MAALAYWGHRLASTAGEPGASNKAGAPERRPEPLPSPLEETIAQCRADIAALRSGVGHFFRQSGKVSLTPSDALTESRDLEAPDAALALHALRHILHHALDEDGNAGENSTSDAARDDGSKSVALAR